MKPAGVETREPVFNASAIRKLLIAFIVLAVTQTGTIIYMVAESKIRDDAQERKVVEIMQEIDDLRRRIESFHTMNDNIIELKVQMQTASNLLGSMVLSLRDVAYEQQRRTPIIDRADRFMDDHIKDHQTITDDRLRIRE